MLTALDRGLTTATRMPERSVSDQRAAELSIVVIFTSVDATAAALKSAGTLAENLGVRITLIIPQIVPYPLPLTSPPVRLDFQEKRFCEIASKFSVDIQVQLYLCRDETETLTTVLQPHSLLVIGGRKRWWPTRENKLARRLRNAGHEVIFTETE